MQVDNAPICEGIARSKYQWTERYFCNGVMYKDNKVDELARENGSFIQSCVCQGLVAAKGDGFYACSCYECGNVLASYLQELSMTEKQSQTNSLEKESLDIIARLNWELCSKKQQLMQLWTLVNQERKRADESENKLQPLKDQVDVCTDEEWTVNQEQLRIETIKELHLQNQNRTSLYAMKQYSKAGVVDDPVIANLTSKLDDGPVRKKRRSNTTSPS